MANPDEKRESVMVNTAQSESSDFQHESQSPLVVASNWNPGYGTRFPFQGFAGRMGVLLCTGVIIAVLVASDNVSSSDWSQKIGPSVIINGFTSIGSLCLALAVAEGVAIAWWRKALRGATVAELHQSWQFSMSIAQILGRFWALDRIALASLAVKLAILDGFLFQRATTTYTTQDPAKNVTLLGAAAQFFPQTGFVVNEGSGAKADFMIGDTYSPTVNTWETSNGFFRDFETLFRNCDGVCYTHVKAVGFEIDCQEIKVHTDYASGAIAAYDNYQSTGTGNSSQWTDLPIFDASFGMMYRDSTKDFSRLTMNLLYFDSDSPYGAAGVDACPGTITNVHCTLRPALVRYPVTVVNYTNAHITNGISIGGAAGDGSNTMTPAPPNYNYALKQAEGFEVLSYISTNDQNQGNSTTQLGGIANALTQFLSSTAAITYNGSTLWGLSQKGTMAQTMMFGPPNMGSCDCSFRDALSTLVDGINQLVFLTATSLIEQPVVTPEPGTQATVVGIRENGTVTYQDMPDAIQISDVIHYRTHYLYLALGVATTVGCLLLVLPSFWQYGVLGRNVTLGPMEIASAFRAPILETGYTEGKSSAGDVNYLIKNVGNRKVMYGVVEDEQESPSEENGRDERLLRRSVRLAMEEPAKVRPLSGVWETGSNGPTSPRSLHSKSTGPVSPLMNA